MRALPRRILAALAVCACASPAPIPEVTITPDPADTRDDLVVSIGGAPATTLRWFVDDVPVEDVAERIPASMTERGQVWRVVVTSHGEKDTATASASVTIRNARPTVRVAIGPDDPEAGDALVVAAVPWDADGDPMEVVYRWSRDGQRLDGLEGDRVPVDTTRRGETWTVTVEANDGAAWSEPVEASVVVRNGAPEVIEAGLTPALPTADDPLRAWVQAEDPDGDAITTRFVWSVDGTVVQDGPSDRLEPGPYRKGDVVEARVHLSDGLGAEAHAHVIGAVTIRNRPPGRPAVRVLPDDPVSGEALRCTLEAPATDPDGDKITAYRATWTVDGEVFDEARETVFAGDTVPRGHTLGEQTWQCAAQAFDGEGWSTATTDSVDVDWAGWQASQTVAGRTVTCDSVETTASYTTCIGLRVDGLAFPNGLSCSAGWSPTPSPRTDHGAFCALITDSTSFVADYGCATTETRVTWSGGAWGTWPDNGLTRSLRCNF